MLSVFFCSCHVVRLGRRLFHRSLILNYTILKDICKASILGFDVRQKYQEDYGTLGRIKP